MIAAAAAACGAMVRSQGWTIEEVAKAAWAPRSNGFSGEYCHKCKTTINMQGGGPGYLCPVCGNFNAVCFSHNMLIHDHPDLGPPRSMLDAGYALAKQRAEAARKFDVGDRVLVDTRGGTSYHYGPLKEKLGIIVARNDEFGIPAPEDISCGHGCQAYEFKFNDGSTNRTVFWEKSLRAAA